MTSYGILKVKVTRKVMEHKDSEIQSGSDYLPNLVPETAVHQPLRRPIGGGGREEPHRLDIISTARSTKLQDQTTGKKSWFIEYNIYLTLFAIFQHCHELL